MASCHKRPDLLLWIPVSPLTDVKTLGDAPMRMHLQGGSVREDWGGLYAVPDCYLSVYYNPSTEMYEYGIFCDWYVLEVYKHTYGIAAARVTFGDDTTSTASWGNKPMSTLAFKGNSTYQPFDWSVHCTPPALPGTTAPCDTSASDVYAVLQVAGYEDKILIDDNDCTIFGVRQDDHSDAVANCFVRDGGNWWTNLPNYYVDTTASDSKPVSAAGVGTTHSKNIVEGVLYAWYITFYQMGEEAAPTAHTAKHNSAVTYHYPLVSNPAFNYFNVEQTTIAPSSFVQ